MSRCTTTYFYIADPDFGLGFIKLCAYFPYPGKVWLNGHDWAKRQALAEGQVFTELANGFAACAEPARLQAICDRLGPADLRGGPAHTPETPTTARLGIGRSSRCVRSKPRAPSCSMRPGEHAPFSRPWSRTTSTWVAQTRSQLIFARQIRTTTTGSFSTRIVTRGVDVTVNIAYKHSRIKEYLKEGRALRIETVCNNPRDLGCQRRLPNLPQLQAKARAANRRLLTIQRAGQGCVLSTTLFERVALPSLEEGQRTGALRFGEPRTMALVGSHNKFKYELELGLFRVRGVLPLGASLTFVFGFVRLIGVIEAEQTEDGQTTRNDRLIGVAADSRDHLDIQHLFVSNNTAKGKEVNIRARR